MGGYLMLLQCWIYEYFCSVHQCVTGDAYTETTPRALRWLTTKAHIKGIKGASYRACLDALTIIDVSWLPYSDHRAIRGFDLISCYKGKLRWGHVVVSVRPERVVRQFGYIQIIPPSPVTASLLYDEIDDWWMHFGDHLAPEGEICVVPGQVSADYMDWFFQISHPFITPTQEGDQPRQPVAPYVDAYIEPHVPEVAVVDDLPRHLVVSCEECEVILERLERVLNLRMVTAGTELHDIMEDCLQLTNGETSVGSLRARRRQHID
ncbi:hypothetical protein GmHk_09G025103 [Glycine max]|uniref:uncharacterized protein LOC114368131 n=1 Tax=Glycine soja TaxID=3848 RepID=UPI001038CAF5|nr:uncharacterized protein LOC114368131 [Glycine soja]KAH1232451.1 hypothetical protein GmHk_09G025103 [Glycine max]